MLPDIVHTANFREGKGGVLPLYWTHPVVIWDRSLDRLGNLQLVLSAEATKVVRSIEVQPTLALLPPF